MALSQRGVDCVPHELGTEGVRPRADPHMPSLHLITTSSEWLGGSSRAHLRSRLRLSFTLVSKRTAVEFKVDLVII